MIGTFHLQGDRDGQGGALPSLLWPGSHLVLSLSLGSLSLSLSPCLPSFHMVFQMKELILKKKTSKYALRVYIKHFMVHSEVPAVAWFGLPKARNVELCWVSHKDGKGPSTWAFFSASQVY